ncbi:MAG TPA: metal-dependent hydrolase [Candidatus Dormibacteraeota bacterium]|nr:metal-dependent hydrolase [Candidatus Dormibacteraeota bacterium]
MEPFTHILASWALARAGLKRATPLATPMIITAGLAADLDWAAYWAGPQSFLTGHRTFCHSMLGALTIAVVVAGIFWLIGRRYSGAQVSLRGALMVCIVGATSHLLIDFSNPWGLKLFWPFTGKWVAWDLLDEVDPWVLAILLSSFLLPGLFRLVGEEIGTRKKSGEVTAAIVAVVLVAGYIGGRVALHQGAMAILQSRLYHREVPKAVGAFPHSGSPFTWSGVVETESALYVVEVSTLGGAPFDPDGAKAQYKPEPSAALESARNSRIGADFLKFARFPKATVEPTETGYRVKFSDLRFTGSRSSRLNLIAVIDLDRQAKVLHEELLF